MFREKREAEERERELEAARQLEERVSAAYEAALVDRATELREELERLYQAEIEKRVKQRIEEIERELQRAHEEKRRVEVGFIIEIKLTVHLEYVMLFSLLFTGGRKA